MVSCECTQRTPESLRHGMLNGQCLFTFFNTKMKNDPKADPHLVAPAHTRFKMSIPASSLPNVLTAITIGLDQILPHQSEAISGQGILIGRIYRLYLHSPSSLNCAIDLGLGHGGLASR